MKITKQSTSNEIKAIWFIKSDDGVDNCCISVEGYKKPMRGRSAMICLRIHNSAIYICAKENKDGYGMPGGGWDIDESPNHAALRELHEEVGFHAEQVSYEGVLIEYCDQVADWVKEHVKNPNDWWYGYYSKIYVGTYAGKYAGHVEERDKEKGYKWYLYKDIRSKLSKEYVNAIEYYLETTCVRSL